MTSFTGVSVTEDGGAGRCVGPPPDEMPITVLFVGNRNGVLEQLGRDDDVELVTVSDGATALERLEERPINCVVSRYELPDTDGIALLDRIREQYCTLPYVLVVADGSEAVARAAVNAGANGYLALDETASEGDTALQERIETAVDRSRACIEKSQLSGIEQALEYAADAILVTDRDGTIEYVNPSFETVTGYSREEALGENPRIVKSGEQDDTYYEEMWDSILAGEVWEEEIINETKSGERYVAHQTVAPVTDDDGTVEKFVGIQRDVTERRRLEEQIERSEETLSELYDTTLEADDPIEEKIGWVLEIGTAHLDYPLGYFTRIAEGTQEILASAGDHEKIQPGATDPLERTYCRKTIEQDAPLVLGDAKEEGWADDPAFEHFGLRCYVGAEVQVDGEVYGTLCFGGEKPEDRTILEIQQSTVKTLARWVGYELERHRYERKLERQNERLENFASVTSHDLRNPLNVAQARLDLGRKTGENEHFEKAAEAHERMEEIIGDTLTLARKGELVEETTTVALDRLARRCWETIRTGDATLEVVDEIEVEGDADRLQYVFENLFRNSIEHGGAAVTVEIGSTEGGFYVADDGPGIPPGEREQVFEHGYSGDDGTGFGLAIVETIASAHGWAVRVTGSWAGGARFEFDTDGHTQQLPMVGQDIVER